MGTDRRRHLIEVLDTDSAADRAVVGNLDGSKRAQARIELVRLLCRRPVRRGIGEMECLRLRLAIGANRAIGGERISAVCIGCCRTDDGALSIQELNISAGYADFVCILDPIVIGIIVDKAANRRAAVVIALGANSS
jgi:hypothetical protein